MQFDKKTITMPVARQEDAHVKPERSSANVLATSANASIVMQFLHWLGNEHDLHLCSYGYGGELVRGGIAEEDIKELFADFQIFISV